MQLDCSMICVSVTGASLMTILDELFERELRKPTVFKNESVFDHSHLPETLPFRENQLRQLIHHYRSLLTESVPSHNHVILYGPVGVGKTTTMRLFGQMALQKSREFSKQRNFRYVHVNCRRYRRSSYQALKAIMTEIWGPMSPRGYSTSELVEMLESVLLKKQMHLLVVLDEAEYLLRHDSDLLNYLIKLKDVSDSCTSLEKNFGVSVSLIVRHQHLESILDDATISSLKRNYIYFPPYDKHQLTEILRLRALKGLKSGVMHERVLEMIAEIAAMKGGDCRLGLELLLRSGKVADEEGSTVITSEHVRTAVMSIYQVEKSIIHSLDETKKKIIHVLISSFNMDDVLKGVPQEDLWKCYQQFCSKNKISVSSVKQFRKHLQELAKLGLILFLSDIEPQTLVEGVIKLAPDIPLAEISDELFKKDST